jgi:beta-N-acetylhexosaminidase
MKKLLVASLIIGGSAGSPSVDHVTHLVRPTPQQIAVSTYQHMTSAQRVGQLFMAGVPSTGPTRQDLAVLRQRDIGSVILNLNTTKSIRALRHQDAKLSVQLTVNKTQPYISTDQEGGLVQRLRGPGFSAIPTALAQGGYGAAKLRSLAATWGGQLERANVNLDLAPVADVVPAQHAKQNQPIGRYDREFGHTPAVVGTHVQAFVRGMHDASEAVTVKHFPGLGRANGNTDLSRHVTDPTTRHDRYLAPYRLGIESGAEFLMVSSAAYPNIDGSRPACFSRTIMHAMARQQLKFGGVVISDDLGTSALAHVPLGTRATTFFNAGGTMLLDTSIGQIPAMASAVVARASTDDVFAARIKRAVLTVLATKAAGGLIPS